MSSGKLAAHRDCGDPKIIHAHSLEAVLLVGYVALDNIRSSKVREQRKGSEAE